MSKVYIEVPDADGARLLRELGLPANTEEIELTVIDRETSAHFKALLDLMIEQGRAWMFDGEDELPEVEAN